jgi:hypothetical protein
MHTTSEFKHSITPIRIRITVPGSLHEFREGRRGENCKPFPAPLLQKIRQRKLRIP